MVTQPDHTSEITNHEAELFSNQGAQKLLRETPDKLQLSNHIGKQWEDVVCTPTLEQLSTNPEQACFYLNLPPNHAIGAVVALDTDTLIKREARGLKIPDTVLVETDTTDPSFVILRACDFKFNLNMAQYRQVSPRTLSELLIQSPAARTTIESAISQLKTAGKLDGEYKVSDHEVVDQSQTEFMPLDEARKIRGYTGRFISPDTAENRSYFERGGNIRPENVFTKQLIPSEIDNLLVDVPGQDLASVAAQIPAETMSLLDKRLQMARIQATMAAKGITSLEELKRFLEHPQDFPDPTGQKPDISQSSDLNKTLGPLLRAHFPKVKAILEGTTGQEKDTRLAALSDTLNTLNLPTDSVKVVIDYCSDRL